MLITMVGEKWHGQLSDVVLKYCGDNIFRIFIKDFENVENISSTIATLELDVTTNSPEHRLQFPCLTTFNDILFTLNDSKIDEFYDTKYGILIDTILKKHKYDVAPIELAMTFKNAITQLFLTFLEEKYIRKAYISYIPDKLDFKYADPIHIDSHCDLLRYIGHVRYGEKNNTCEVLYSLLTNINGIDIVFLVALKTDIIKDNTIKELEKLKSDMYMMETISFKIHGQ